MIPHPGYYDQLFLEKAKLLLQAALNSKTRRGGPTSYEEFVVALDVHEEASQRAFEVILQETTLRRPRKVEATNTTSTNTTATRRNRDTAEQGARFQTGLTLPFIDAHGYPVYPPSSPSSPSNDSSEEEEDASEALSRRIQTIRSRLLPRPSRLLPDNRFSTNDDSHSTSTATGSTRQNEVANLFGFSEPLPSLSQVLADTVPTTFYSSSNSNTSRTPPPQRSSSADFPNLPTFEELWTVLFDLPFPSSTVSSFDSFLRCVNAASPQSPDLRSGDMNALLADLTVRDPVIPIRVRNAVQNRIRATTTTTTTSTTANPTITETLMHRYPRSRRLPIRGGGVTDSNDVTPTTLETIQDAVDRALGSEDTDVRIGSGEGGGGGGAGYEVVEGIEAGEHPLREGIWRASFVEHLEGDVDASRAETEAGTTFSDFARRRRAATRETEEGTQGSRNEEGGGGRMNIETSSSATLPNLQASTSSVSSSFCPGDLPQRQPFNVVSTHHSPRPMTSADIAQAAFRSQRSIAPIPSQPSSSSSLSSQSQRRS